MPPQVPPHLSEQVFRQYEKQIHTIITSYPRSVSFKPENVSLETFSCRLRDAMRSHITYQWPSAVDPQQLKTVRANLVVLKRDGMVIVRSKDDTSDKQTGVIASQDTAGEVPYVCENLTLAELHAFATLLGGRRITGPVKVVGADPLHLSEIEEHYDIAINRDNKDYVLIT